MVKWRIITGLDIGSSAIKILVVQDNQKSDKIQVLSQLKEPSSGVRKGVVISVEEVADTVASSLDKARKESRQRVDQVFVNIGGSHIFCTPSKGLVSVSRADQRISQEDVVRVLEAAKILSVSSNKEVMEALPREFIVDGERGIKDPVGLKGVRLEVEALALGCFSPYLKNLTQAVLGAGAQINDLFFTPLASSRAILRPREKELGVAVLDIGAGNSNLAVFEEGNLVHTAVFPFGSANITNDIAIILKTDIDTAEKVKLEFGSCFYRNGAKKTSGSWKRTSASWQRDKIKSELLPEPLIFSRKNLVDIIHARVKEIFTQVNKELKKISRYALLPSGVVLTGGGSNLPKIVELAKKEMKLPCRLGLPQGFSSLEEDPAFSTVCGLVYLSRDNQEGSYHDFSLGSGLGEKIKKMFRIFNI